MGRDRNMNRKEEKCIRVFVGNAWGRRAFGNPRCRWEYNIKRDL
jgi:hypothetical protein